MDRFLKGLKSGVPIGLGYLSVSFSFGILAVSYGLDWWQALLISMMTLTSAGQLAGIKVMAAMGSYIEMLVSQLTVNIRYSFMAVSLSQKVSADFGVLKRLIFGFFITDEIFAAASAEKEISTRFFAGLAVMPYIGWATGILLGAVLGSVLPEIIMNALCIAIYGMFAAIVVPSVKSSPRLAAVVAVAVGTSCLFFYLPVLKTVPLGLAVSVSAVAAALFGAAVFPAKEDADSGQ